MSDELQLAYDALMSIVDQQKTAMDELIADRDGYRNSNLDLHNECQRLRDANQRLMDQIKAYNAEYDSEVCPRLQCQSASKRWKSDRDGLQMQVDVVPLIVARAEQAEAQVSAMQPVVDRLAWIAGLPVDPRPDGTHNTSREAIIEQARRTMDTYQEGQ